VVVRFDGRQRGRPGFGLVILARSSALDPGGRSRVNVQRNILGRERYSARSLCRERRRLEDLVAHTDALRATLTNRPVRTVPEAAEQIEHLTGLRRGPTQIRETLSNRPVRTVAESIGRDHQLGSPRRLGREPKYWRYPSRAHTLA
jgi:hypothetical protein